MRFELNPEQSELLFWHDCPTLERLRPIAREAYEEYIAEPARLPLDGLRWTLAKIEPLTVVPAVECRLCGLTGFVRKGEWVAA